MADSGPGIPAEFRSRLFERFSKADTSRSQGGSGLGLAIAAENAALIGARIEFVTAPDDRDALHPASPRQPRRAIMIRRLIPATAVLALTAACGTGGGAVAVQPPSNSDSIVVSSSGSAPAPVVSSTAITIGGHSSGRMAPLPKPGASEQLWLIRGAKLWPTTRIQPRRLSAPVFLLRALGNGPTASERAAGLSSAVAPTAVVWRAHRPRLWRSSTSVRASAARPRSRGWRGPARVHG